MKTNIHQSHVLILACLITASICTANSNEVIATIPTGVNPAGMAITANSRWGYVANNNNYGIEGQDSVTVLDLKHNLPVETITDASFNQPYTITMGVTGPQAYVTNSNSSTITIINTLTNTVSGIINGFDGPSGMVITPAGNRAYVNNYGGPDGVGSGNGKTISIVDLNSNTIIGAPILVGLAPAALAISPDGLFVYVINYVDGNPGTGTMSVIQTSNNTVVATIPGFSGPFAISLTPSGRYAYVTNFGSNNFAPFGTTVSVVDLTTNQIVNTITTGIQPAGVALSKTCYAYVTNYNTLYAVGAPTFDDLTAGQGTVSIIDTKTKEVIEPTILVGQSPANITIAPDNKHAYVSNYTSNTISVIKLKNRR
jgi:YVTN family beta-propeller protein